MTIDMNYVLAGLSILLFAGLLGFFAFLIKHQNEVEPEEKTVEGVELIRQHYGAGETIEQPTPYYVAPIPMSPDPLEIAGNLDKKIVLGGFMLFGVFALIGAYLFTLLIIRADASSSTWKDRVAEEHQLEQAVHRGELLYANLCFDCHGKTGLGATDPDRKDLPGLPLNKPDFKYDNIKNDPAKLAATESLIRLTIERGRPKPPPQVSMPAWLDKEGGPLNDEQVSQLMAFIEHGTDAQWADVVTVRRLSDLPTEPNPPKVVALSPIDHGKALTTNNGGPACVSCHSFTPGQASPVSLAPNLGRYGVEGPLNNELKALKASGDPNWLQKWISNPPAIKPGVIMPPFSNKNGGPLDDAAINDLAAYLMSLGK
ncbi:MAG TPA: c-type cytochrome [Candidatus Limnocylindria bacterium]